MKHRFVGLLALAALVALPALLEAQERTVTGQVTSADTRQPLNAVRVTVKGTLDLVEGVTHRGHYGAMSLSVCAKSKLAIG